MFLFSNLGTLKYLISNLVLLILNLVALGHLNLGRLIFNLVSLDCNLSVFLKTLELQGQGLWGFCGLRCLGFVGFIDF